MFGVRKSARHFSLFVSLILYSLQLPAQALNKPFYNFKTYTTTDGLSSNHLTCVYKDSRGFLWIGTDRGLQRYNGSSFLTFRHLNNDSSSIANEIVVSITEDKKHDIWICTGEGITRFNYSNGKFTNYISGYKDGFKILLGAVFCFFEDSEGKQWLGCTGSGLYLFNKATQQFNHVAPATYLNIKQGFFSWVRNIQEINLHEILFTVKDGFVLINKKGVQQYIKIPEPTNKKIIHLPCTVLPFLKEYPNEIWVASNFNGIFRYHRNTRHWKHFLSGGKLISDYAVWATNLDKNTWLLGGDNTCFFNHRTGIFSKGFDNPVIYAINNFYKDNEDNLWIASNKGLFLLNTSTQLFSSTQRIAGLGKECLIYFDTIQQSLYTINPYYTQNPMSWHPATNTTRRDTIPWFYQHHKVVNNFVEDSNILYFAMNGGMWKFDLSNHQLDSIVYKDRFSNSQNWGFTNICKSDKNIYFANGGNRGGPFAYNKSLHTITDLSIAANSPSEKNHDHSIAFSNGILYIGTWNGDSILRYNEAGNKTAAISIPATYRNNKLVLINGLCVDKKENLWCAASNSGMYVYNIASQKWIRHISQAEGYYATSVNQMVCDEDGTVWCNSSEGLFAFNPDNFTMKNYTQGDGLLTESEGGFLTVLPNHQLAYNNIDGDSISYGIINTGRADTTLQTISMSITNLQVLGKLFLNDTLLDNVRRVILPPNNNAFSLSYAGLSLTNGKKLLYAYLLEGAEKEWHEVGTEQNLSYLNLSPGNYILHLKCKSRDNKIISEERLLYIRLLPAWYQTVWFKIFCIIGLATLLFLAIRYYYQQQLKKQQQLLEKERALTDERNRIAADMHDDVGAGLSRIRYITSSLQSNHSISDADISKIVSLSDESVEKMNEIIWALNQGNQPLEELIYYIRSQCSEMVSNAGLAFTFESPENIQAKTLGWKDCRNIYLLVKEAVNNAIKHSGASIITIEYFTTNNLQFSIADNGKGFDQELIKKDGNGLLNYKKRIQVLNGNYQLITSPGNGTKLLFTIPLNSI